MRGGGGGSRMVFSFLEEAIAKQRPRYIKWGDRDMCRHIYFWFTYVYTHTIGALKIRIRVWVMLYYNLTRPGGNTVANCSDRVYWPKRINLLGVVLVVATFAAAKFGLRAGGGGRGSLFTVPTCWFRGYRDSWVARFQKP